MADNPLARFFSREAGQQRRRALNALDQRINDTLSYYLGPQLAPRVGQAANALAMFSPGMDVQEAVQASGEMMAPNRTPLDRAASGAALAGALGAMFMPGGVSSIRQGVEDVADAAVRAYDPNTTNAFTVWHGSPHDFDRFSLDKIGTGEGAQAYGHGLYFAESRPVAEGYRDALANRTSLGYFNPDFNAKDLLQRFGGDEEWAKEVLADSIKSADGPTREQLQATFDSIATGSWKTADLPTGRLYEVSIDANPEDFLDWDRPLSEGELWDIGDVFSGSMSPELDELSDLFKYQTLPDTMTGREARRWIGATLESGRVPEGVFSDPGGRFSAEADKYLREAGFPGIRYLDAGSRGAGDGSRNYVVFNDQLLSILNKYGLAGGAALGAGALAMQPGEAQAMPPEASFLEKYLP